MLVIWDNGLKKSGRIKKIYPARSFAAARHAMLQTYLIRCSDKIARPAHAWHIKKVFSVAPASGRRRLPADSRAACAARSDGPLNFGSQRRAA